MGCIHLEESSSKRFGKERQHFGKCNQLDRGQHIGSTPHFLPNCVQDNALTFHECCTYFRYLYFVLPEEFNDSHQQLLMAATLSINSINLVLRAIEKGVCKKLARRMSLVSRLKSERQSAAVQGNNNFDKENLLIVLFFLFFSRDKRN